MWGVWFGAHLSPAEMGTERIMTRERGGRGETIHLSRAHEMKSLSNKQTKDRSVVQADATPRGPYSLEWLGWMANTQVWSWIKAVFLPELVCRVSDCASGICFSSRASSANILSKLMACSRCSINMCWKNGLNVTPQLCPFVERKSGTVSRICSCT